MNRRLRAGSLRQLVTLMALQTTQDNSDGQITEEYVAVADVWADVRMVSGKEYVSADARQSNIVATVRIRYRADIVPSMRLQYRGRTLLVVAILDDPFTGSEWITLACSEIQEG